MGILSTTDGEISNPWDQIEKDIFFGPTKIIPSRWNKFYPYRLVVIDAKTNQIQGEGSDIVSKLVGAVTDDGSVAYSTGVGIEYIGAQYYESKKWAIQLPISPQQLSITDQYSIVNTPTMRGVVEEHNGLKYKLIQASGTMGVTPYKSAIADIVPEPSTLNSIFGGTIEAFGDLVDQAKQLARALNGGHPKKPMEFKLPADIFTGYVFALRVQQFLERYVQLKKNPKYKDWRLVFDIPKQNESFIVTPQVFSIKRNAEKPQEFFYNFQFKAWKRIVINQDNLSPASNHLNIITTDIFSRINTILDKARSVLGAVTNLIKAVRSDISKVFNVLRKMALVVKDLVGAVVTLADVSTAIINLDDFDNALADFKSIIKNATSSKRTSYQPDSAGYASALVVREITSSLKVSKAIAASEKTSEKNEGLSSEAVAGGALGIQAAQDQETDPSISASNEPEADYDIASQISLDSLSLSPQQLQAIQDEIELARLTTIDDLRDFKQEMTSLALDLSDYFGAGNATYSQIYGRPAPSSRPVEMSIEENEILQVIYDVVQGIDLLTATKQFDDSKIQSPLEYVGGLARQNGMTFQDSTSKMPMPVPFGLTIEEIAARYLGNADRWVEIATINSLRSPYIDEDGFILPMLSNANGRQFTVNNENSVLYVGQQITLYSDTVPRFVRRIANIEKLNDVSYLVSVDGLADLDNLKLANRASIQAYLPGTVNSQNRIYIPTNQPIQPDDRTFEIDTVEDQELARISKIDWLLDDNKDVAINGLGDLRLSSGMTNLIQALKLKIETKKGSLLRHMDYGMGLQAGVSIADIENGSIIKALNNMIAEDSRFSAVNRIDLFLEGNTLRIDMQVTIANTGKALPINFKIRL